MKPRVQAVQKDFAYVTHDGEIILLDELVREVHAALEALGIETDLFPLRCMLVATRAVTESIAAGDLRTPDPEALCGLVADALRGQRMIASLSLIRSVLEEYLRQLHRLDIAQVRYY